MLEKQLVLDLFRGEVLVLVLGYKLSQFTKVRTIIKRVSVDSFHETGYAYASCQVGNKVQLWKISG